MNRVRDTVLKRTLFYRERWNRNQNNPELLLLKHAMEITDDNSAISIIDQILIELGSNDKKIEWGYKEYLISLFFLGYKTERIDGERKRK